MRLPAKAGDPPLQRRGGERDCAAEIGAAPADPELLIENARDAIGLLRNLIGACSRNAAFGPAAAPRHDLYRPGHHAAFGRTHLSDQFRFREQLNVFVRQRDLR